MLFQSIGYSQNICVDCKNDILRFYNFRSMCISSDESMRSNRRPVSRNNEHDYSAWKIDEYDMDLSEYLIEGTTLKDEDTSPEDLIRETQIIERVEPTIEASFDETQNFDISTKKKVRKTYACPICGKFWVTPSKLKRHLGSHKKDVREKTPQPISEQIQCPICNLIVDAKMLPQHMTDAHIKPDNRPEYANGVPLAEKIGKKYICSLCSFEVTSPSSLQSHMKSQHMKNENPTLSKKKYVCQFCHKVLITPSKLQRHLRTHSKRVEKIPKIKRPARPRRHECIHCGKKFETPSKLLRHMTSVHREFSKNANSSETTLEISTVTSILGD